MSINFFASPLGQLIIKKATMKIQLSDKTTVNFDENKPVRILLCGMLKGEQGKLTGNWEEQIVYGESQAMLEVDHAFGKDFIFADYISQ